MPYISIIVPVYNVESYLDACIESILKQSYKDFEVICVNDGSTDSSLKILNKWKKLDSRIIVFDQKNQGLSVARNQGIERATGKYICFVDSDDMLVEDALKCMYQAACHNNVQIVGYETAPLLYENDSLKNDPNKDEYYRIKHDYQGIRLGRELLVEFIEQGDFVESAWLMLINRDWLNQEQIRFVPGAYYEDSAFALEVYFKAEKVMHVKNKLYIYRVRENSIMTQKFTFDHLKWRVWQFTECLRHMFVSAENEREKNAIAKYARQIMSNIIFIYNELDEEDRAKIGQLAAIDRLMVDTLGLDESRTINKNLAYEGLMTEINQRKNIVLYGAGVVGNKIYKLLKLKNIHHKIMGYAVSNHQDISYKNGIVVKKIDEYNSCNVDLLLISSCNYHSEMITQARKIGFKRILVITHEIENAIDNQLLKADIKDE